MRQESIFDVKIKTPPERDRESRKGEGGREGGRHKRRRGRQRKRERERDGGGRDREDCLNETF